MWQSCDNHVIITRSKVQQTWGQREQRRHAPSTNNPMLQTKTDTFKTKKRRRKTCSAWLFEWTIYKLATYRSERRCNEPRMEGIVPTREATVNNLPHESEGEIKQHETETTKKDNNKKNRSIAKKTENKTYSRELTSEAVQVTGTGVSPFLPPFTQQSAVSQELATKLVQSCSQKETKKVQISKPSRNTNEKHKIYIKKTSKRTVLAMPGFPLT